MRTVFFIMGTLSILLIACHRKGEPSVAKLADTLSQTGDLYIKITPLQFRHAEMEEGGIVSFAASELIACNGYIDVPPQNRYKIAAQLGGNVIMSNLLPGDKVSRGQVVLSLQNIEFLKLQQTYLETKEKLAYLKSVFETQSTLASENISSRKNQLQARTEFMAMLATYESLSKQLEMINIDPETITAENMVSVIRVISPVNGFIAKMNVENGMFVHSSTEMCEVVDPVHFHLELKVFEKDITKIEPGQSIQFWLPESAGKTYQGKVVLIGKTIEGEDRVVQVHGHIEGEKSLHLTPGMYVEARIKTNERTLKGLPLEALINIDGIDCVFVRKAASDSFFTYERKPVKVGVKTVDRFELLNVQDFPEPEATFLVKGAFNLN